MSVSILASGRGDRLWWRISQSKKVCFQLFPETRNAFYGSDGLRKLVPLCNALHPVKVVKKIGSMVQL